MSAVLMLRLKVLAEKYRAPDLVEFIETGLRRQRAGENAGAAFNLVGRRARAAADAWLLQAAAELDPECRQAPWAVAGVIGEALLDFKTNRWPWARDLDRPDSLSVLDRLFWSALTCCPGVPCTRENLARLISKSKRSAPRSQQRAQSFLTQYRPGVRPRRAVKQ
jgi:hypothetical protein